MNPTTPAQYVIILMELAQQRGVASEDLLEGTSLNLASLTHIGSRVGEQDFNCIIENAFRLTGDRALGLHLGLRLNLSAHATVGQAFMTCKNLDQVLDFFLKYYHILAPGLELEYQQRNGRCWLTPFAVKSELPIEFTTEMLFAAIVHTLQLLVNEPELEFRLELPYAKPDYVDEYEAMFGRQLHFGCSHASLSFDERWLEAEVPSSNTALLALYEQECQRLLADLEEKGSLTERTLQLLGKLEGHYPQMPRVAHMLNFSPRTYRRRLAEENVSFQQLLDRARSEQATHYLTTTRLPLASIAFMVGFNDVSNFRRAYIKWTGNTPQKARREGSNA